MRNKRTFLAMNVAFAFTICTLARSPVAAAEGGHALGRYIPDTVHIYASGRSDPAQDALIKPYMSAWNRLVESGVGQDLFDLATIELRESEKEQARRMVERVFELLGTPNWSALAEHEVAFGMQYGIPLPEYAVLFRVHPDTLDERQAEFRQLFEGVRSFAPDQMAIRERQIDGAKILSLVPSQVPIPISLSVIVKKDVLVLTTSERFLETIVELLGQDEDDNSGSIAGNSRFRKVRKSLPKGGISETFVNIQGIFGFVRQLIKTASLAAASDPELAKALSIADNVLKELGKLGHLAVANRVEGRRSIADGRLNYRGGNDPGYIERLIAAQEPVNVFLDVVPKDALNFWATSGVRPVTIYDSLLATIAEVPDGDEALGMWSAIQQQIGLDLREDVLSWIDGGCAVMTLPGKNGRNDCVVSIRVLDDEKAKSFMKGVGGAIASWVRGRGQEIEFAPVEGAEGFFEMRIAAIPFFRPIFGTVPGVIVIGSSMEAVRKVGATVEGRNPSIRERDNFKIAGAPDDGLVEAYFYDVGGTLTAVANVYGTIGFFLSLLPDVPREEEIQVARKVGNVMVKLSIFLRDIDLPLDVAGWSAYDAEKHQIRGRNVTTFR